MADINKKIGFQFKSTSDLPEVQKQLQQLIDLAKQQEVATKTANAAYVQQAAAIAEAMKLVTDSSRQAISLQAQQLTGQKQLTEAVQVFGKEAKTSADMQAAALKDVNTTTANIAQGFRDLQTLIGFSLSVSAVKSFVNEMIEAKSKLDFFKLGLDNIIGSERAVTAVYNDLVKIAKTTPFSMDDLTKVTLSLSAMGVETNKLIPTIEALGDVAAIAGSDKLPRIAKAYTDVMAKGILMKQEINQFAENSIPIYDMLAVSMEKTRDEVVKLASDHKISFADVEKAFKDATSEGGRYFNMAITQSKTLGGQMKNMEDTIKFAKAAFGDFYENALTDMIGGFGDLIEMLAGSQSAVKRTVTVIEAGAAAFVTYQVAVNGAAIKEAALTVAIGVKNAAMTVARTATSLYIIAIGAADAATLGFTEAQIAAAAALKASPWGLIITLIGAATTAYLLFDAATQEVVYGLGEEEIKLKNSQALLNDSVLRVKNLTEGTKERTKAMAGLISQYPEYFSGLSAESTNNATLNKILMAVNDSYADRIELARNAYQLDKLEKQRTELLKQEDELMERIRVRFPSLYKEVAGNSQKLYETMLANQSDFYKKYKDEGSFFGNIWEAVFDKPIMQSAKSIAEGLKNIDKQVLDSTVKRQTLTAAEIQTAINAENARWDSVNDNLKKGTKAYELALGDHNKRIAQITGETTTATIKGIDEVDKKKKSSLELSLENNVQELKGATQTYETKMKLLNAQEDLEIEVAKRTITRKTDLENRIQSINVEYINKRAALMQKEIESNIDYDMKDLKRLEENSKKAIDLKQKGYDNIEDLTNHINGIMQKESEDNIKRAEKAGDRLVELAKKTLAETQKAEAEEAGNNRDFWESKEAAVAKYWIKVQSENLAGYNEQKKQLEEVAAYMEKIYGADSYQFREAQGDIFVNEQDIEKATRLLNKYEESLKESRKQTAISIGQMVDEIATGITNSLKKGYEGAMDAYDGAVDALDGMRDANKSAMDQILEDTTLSYEERERRVRINLENEKQMIKDVANLQDMRDATEQQMLEITNRINEVAGIAKIVTSLISGDYKEMAKSIIQTASDWFNHSEQEFNKEIENREKGNVRMYQSKLSQLQMEMDAETRLLQAKFEMWDKEVEAFRNKIAEEERLNTEWINKLQDMERQYSSDSQLRLKEDANFRAQLLNEGEAREVAALEAAKQRQLDYARSHNASEQEMSDITQAFDALITQKHKEYADARGDKDKEISLAAQEQKAQETDKVGTLEKQLTDMIKDLKNQLVQKEQEVSAAKQRAQEEYAKYVEATQWQMFEAQKAMAIAEIRVQIAILRGKKTIWNAGKVNDAVDDLNQAINDLAGITNPYSNAGVPSAGRGEGPQAPITPDNIPGRNPGPTPGRGGTGAVGGMYYGTESLDPVPGTPFSRDSILYNLQFRERVVPAEDNIRLINKVGKTSNADLVNGYIQLQEMKKANPELFDKTGFAYKNFQMLSGLPGLMALDYSKLQSMGSPQMNFDNHEVVQAIDRLGKKPTVSITVLPTKIRTEETIGNHKKVYESSYNGKI